MYAWILGDHCWYRWVAGCCFFLLFERIFQLIFVYVSTIFTWFICYILLQGLSWIHIWLNVWTTNLIDTLIVLVIVTTKNKWNPSGYSLCVCLRLVSTIFRICMEYRQFIALLPMHIWQLHFAICHRSTFQWTYGYVRACVRTCLYIYIYMCVFFCNNKLCDIYANMRTSAGIERERERRRWRRGRELVLICDANDWMLSITGHCSSFYQNEVHSHLYGYQLLFFLDTRMISHI